MNLIETMSTPCVIMDKKHVPDGEGGLIVEWVETDEVMLAIATDTSLKAQVGDAVRNTATYTVVAHKGIPLEFYDVFKRKEDGRTFRITSDRKDGEFPDNSPAINDYVRYTAERWELT